jgi:hypothetical protein
MAIPRSLRRVLDRVDRIPSEPLLALAVVGAMLAIGAVHLPALALVALVAAVAAAPFVVQAIESDERLPAPSLGCFALAAYSLVQAAPLPIGLVARLSPESADVWSRALEPMGEPVRQASLSLEPSASARQALVWATYGLIFIAATGVARKRSAAWGLALVLVSASVAAFVTLLHGLAGATRVFGLYEPSFPVLSWHMGPLLNPNNLAGYLDLGVLSGLGLLIASRPILPRWLSGLLIAMCVGVVVITGSRGGALALALGVLLFGALAFRRARANRLVLLAIVLSVFVAGGLLAVLGATGGTWAELLDANVDKLRMPAWVLPMVRQYPIFGVGRGAFEAVFAAYHSTSGNIVYTHAENLPAQWVSEWGAVGGLALVGLAFALRPSPLGVPRSSSALAGWVALVALLLHNLLDLGLEIPGVGVAFAALFGALWSEKRRRRRKSQEPPPASRLARIRGTAVAIPVALVAIVLGVAFGGHELARDRNELQLHARAVAANQLTAVAFRAELRTSLLRHPADPYFPLVGALVAFQSKTENPLPWLQRSLERGRVNPRAHLLLAEVLAGRGARPQALFELRMAIEGDQDVVDPAMRLAARWARDFDELSRAIPDGKAGARALDYAAGHLERDRDAKLRAQCDAEAIARDPSRPDPHVREAESILHALEAKTDRCPDRAACEKDLDAHLELVDALLPDRSIGAELRARRLVLRGSTNEAYELLAKRCAEVVDRARCLVVRARVAAQIKDAAPLAATVKELRASACSTSQECAATMELVGDLFRDRAEVASSMGAYSRACEEEPTDARLMKLADAATRSGAHSRAADVLEKIAAHKPGDAELARRIREERSLANGLPVP